MTTIAFTNLSLYPIAVISMFEMLFGNANQQLYWSLIVPAFSGHIDHSQRESCHRVAASSAKERLYQQSADHALLFWEQ
jgi:hypothetical protein